MDDNQIATETGQVPVAQEPAVATQQKMLSQDEVNKIVAREKGKAAESAMRAAEEKHQRDLEALNAVRMQQEQRNAGTSREVDANAIYQQITEKWNREMQERQQKEHMTQVANNYLNNVAQAKPNYEDFDEVTKDFDASAFPQVTYLLAGIPNGGDVVYDLAKNPTKLAMIDRLAERSPKLAQAELLKLSKSINDNRQAQTDAESQNVSEPLDRVQPSRIAGSNGKMGIRDLKKQPWLRG